MHGLYIRGTGFGYVVALGQKMYEDHYECNKLYIIQKALLVYKMCFFRHVLCKIDIEKY